MRICSLLPSGTEILFALGLQDRIIGVTDLCDYPQEAADIRVVCRSRIDPSVMSSEEVEAEMHRILSSGESPYDLDVEWLQAAAPDLVITQDLCYFCEIDAGTVQRAVEPIPAPPTVLNLNPRTLDEILASFLEVGDSCAVPDRARQLVAGLKERIQTVAGKVDRAPYRPAVFSIEGVNPLVIGGHWVTDLLIRAGGRLPERFAPGCPAERIAWEDVVSARPDKALHRPLLLRSRPQRPRNSLARRSTRLERPARRPLRRGLPHRPQHPEPTRPSRRRRPGTPGPTHPSRPFRRAHPSGRSIETQPKGNAH